MKKLIIFAATFIPFAVSAQNTDPAQAAAEAINAAPAQQTVAPKPNYWKTSLGIDLGVSQTALVNWAAGGNNSVSLAGALDAKANYAKDLIEWNNRLQLDYAFMFLWGKDNELDPFQKSNDRIYLESKWSRNMTEQSKWRYSAAFDFKTQFSDGYDYSKTEKLPDGTIQRDRISAFFAPAYINLALGVDWKPNNWFDMSIAPLTGGVIVVTDNDKLRDKYGMKHWEENGITYYNSALFQLGAQMKANARAVVNDKFSFETQLVLFYDYLYDYKAEGAYTKFPVRVNWDNKLSWNVSKLFKLGLNTWLVFDPLVKFTGTDGSISRKVQFKEFFTVNFTYTIANFK